MERPAISMEGGATPMEQFATAVCEAFEKKIDVIADLRGISNANFDEMRLTVRRI